MNSFSYVFLAMLSLGIATQWLLLHRHIRHINRHRGQVPEAFRDKITLEEHQKAADYTIARSRTGQAELIISSVLLLVWTLGGLLESVDIFWRPLTPGPILYGISVILSIMLISALLDIPMSLYRTFRLEEHFGFNKTTPKTFILDLVKGLLLTLLIGTPIIALVLWIMQSAGQLWWLYVWLTWFAFSLLMMWAYPAFIAPVFNKFRPLDNEALRTRIEALLDRNGFTSQGIFVMDGSTRSSHGNAYFTGLGANKRIVFFDTLINDLSHEQIEAVLAHELGHFKCHHIKKRIAAMAGISLIGLAILGWLIDQPWFYQGLGVNTPSIHMALILFMLASPAFTFFLQPVFSLMSRKHEFEADNFAAKQAQADDLIQALVKLYKENANTLTPDPMYSAFHDSHPPAPIRIANLNSMQAGV